MLGVLNVEAKTEKVYATFENPTNTNTTWDAATKTFTWSTTYYNQLRNIGLPNGDISKYKKLVVDCDIKTGNQFRILFYKGGSNLTLFAKTGINEFIIKDELEKVAPNDYNEYILACDEICLSGDNGAAPGEAVINSVYLETYPENEFVDIPDIVEEEDPGRPTGDFIDLTADMFSGAVINLQKKIGNGEIVYGQKNKDSFVDLSDYSELTIIATPGLKLVLNLNHEVDIKENLTDYAEDDAGKYVWIDAVVGEDGKYTLDLSQYNPVNLNNIRMPWDNNNKGTVWYLLLTKKAAVPVIELPQILTFPDYNDAEISSYTAEWTATMNGATWTFNGFNNNKNAWTLIKCGRKTNEQTATITSPALDAVVKDVVFTVTKASNITKVTFDILNGSETISSTDITDKFVVGDIDIPVEGAKGYSYKLTIESSSASANGTTEITKIGLYGEGQYVKKTIANTAETAYTVAEAISLIDAGEALTDVVFVKGIVSQVDKFENGAITYWISDDGTTTNQFECYKGKGIDGADFAAVEDVEVGASVIVTGTMTKYKEIYEFNADNKLVSYQAAQQGQDEAQILIDYPNKKDGTSISGTTTEGTVKIHTNTDAVACYTLKNGYASEGVCNDNYIKLETEGGFKAGDVLTIAGAINNSDESKWGTCAFFTMDADKNVTEIKKFENFINSRLVADDPIEQTYTLEADYDVILLGRQGNTGTNLTLIKVVRGGGESETNPDEELAEAPEGWESLITNGNLASDDVSCFFSKEAPASDPYASTITAGAGKDKSRGIIVKSADNPSQTWDTQFFIRANKQIPAGTKLHMEFDYKASQAAPGATQGHGEPGSYVNNDGVGTVSFTTEWQHLSKDFTSTKDIQTIAFNLAEENTATEYYIDNIIFWAEKAVEVEWVDIVKNGNMEGENVSFFVTKIYPATEPTAATLTEGAGKTGKGIKIESAAQVANPWDTQFWISLPIALEQGTKFKVEFDFKADAAVTSSMQYHALPGDYITNWVDQAFTTDWQHFEKQGIAPAANSAGNKFQSIAFNLSFEQPTTIFFDNVKLYLDKETAATGIQDVYSIKAEPGAIFDLQGRRVAKPAKGLYIINGKKIMVK
jgi:hypothetical protein